MAGEVKQYHPIIQPILDAFATKADEPAHFADQPKIQVDQVVSHLAFVYEKLRNVIDFKEETLIRKNAVERILKRRVGLGGTAKNITLPLIKELIRGGYLDNNTVPEFKIAEVNEIIDKYIKLANLIYQKKSAIQQKDVFQWLFGMAAVEIDRKLVYQGIDEALMLAMETVVKESVVFDRIKLSDEDRDLQFFLAIRRVFVRSDESMINFDLWSRSFPEWKNPTDQLFDEFAAHIDEIYRRFEAEKNHPLGERLRILMRRYSVLFRMLKDVISEEPAVAADILKNPEILEEKIREACDERYTSTRKRLRRTAVRAILYVFLTKMLVAILLEVPIDFFLLRNFHMMPLVVNTLFHPFLMFLIVLAIRTPSDENTDRVVSGLKVVVYDGGKTNAPNRVKGVLTQGSISSFVFRLFYGLTFILSFGLIIFALVKLQFSIPSMILFLLFLSIVTFFGIKLRQTATELVVLKRRENIVTLLLDVFSIPLLRVGHWIAQKAPKVNVFIFVFDVIFEAPFKAFIEILEDWISFLREKKENIY
ncbi:MAG TPA: hypothetical protein VJC11_03800 [Patescibacteria group bacterium]|nr:hypothetical protein [Patescibacteria group bacterium]